MRSSYCGYHYGRRQVRQGWQWQGGRGVEGEVAAGGQVWQVGQGSDAGGAWKGGGGF